MFLAMWSIDLGKPEKALKKEPKVSPEWTVDQTPSRIVAVPNLRPKIANKLSNPSIVVSDENIADNLDDVREPGKKIKTKSEPEKVDKITFILAPRFAIETTPGNLFL